jgi:aspartate aminotransferase-like enzyme
LAEGFESMGLELLVGQKEYRSPGVTAVKIPEMRAESVREALDGMGLETAGGQGKLNGHIFRVGHFTWEGWPEICLILGSVWAACREVGISLREPDLKNVREVYEREDTPCGKSL